MTLQEYLSSYFYTRPQLLAAAQLSESAFEQLQQAAVMPQPSYVLRNTLTCQSFFGEHTEATQTQYYPRQSVEWLNLLAATPERDTVLAVFRTRYRDTIARLRAQGFVTGSTKLGAGLDAHIDEEWAHFMAGTYGVCTRSGLPEDIAGKELAIVIIKEVLGEGEDGQLDGPQRQRLTDAVNLLDAASSDFAPHECDRSSRRRLIDDVREKYRLDSNAAGGSQLVDERISTLLSS